MSYTDPGYSAHDVEDGDITANVTVAYFKLVTGTLVAVTSIDTADPGEYQINYSVSDAGGNTANESRIVNVLPLLLAEPSNDAFLFTPHVVMQILDIDTGQPVSTLYNLADFELKYKDTGVVIATGTDTFDFNVTGSLDEKVYIFTVDKGLPTEQSFEFTIIHYPIDRVYYSTIGKGDIDYELVTVGLYKNDEAISDNTFEVLDWGVTSQLMLKVNGLIEEGGVIEVYDAGTLIQTINNPRVDGQYTITGVTSENISVKYNYNRYGHQQGSVQTVDILPYRNILNRVGYGELQGESISNYLVLNQTLTELPIIDNVAYTGFGHEGISGYLQLNQTLTDMNVADNVAYNLLGETAIMNHLVIQQSNTEVN